MSPLINAIWSRLVRWVLRGKAHVSPINKNPWIALKQCHFKIVFGFYHAYPFMRNR